MPAQNTPRDTKEFGKPRAPRITEKQKSTLIQLLEANPMLVSKKFTTQFTFAEQNRQWALIANQLSDYGPPKSVDHWKKVSERNEGMLANVMFVKYSLSI